MLHQKNERMNFHSFKVTDIKGKEFDLSQLKGKKVLVVNTASECGNTPQFENLEEIYRIFGPDSNEERFEIIGFPSNDFGGQDPGTDDEINAFCTTNYGVTFPMMSKVNVIGNNTHPLFKWLAEQAKVEIKWNFEKFLIDAEGNVVGHFGSKVLPIDDEIVNWIKDPEIKIF